MFSKCVEMIVAYRKGYWPISSGRPIDISREWCNGGDSPPQFNLQVYPTT